MKTGKVKAVHILKSGTERLGDYKQPLCGSYNRGTLRFAPLAILATCKRCQKVGYF